MLTILRKYRTSVPGFVILCMVSFTMVGFGLNFFASGGPNDTVIKVDDREISYLEYSNRLSNFRSMLQQRFGENFQQFSKMFNIEQQTIDQIIDSSLLDAYVAALDVTPSTNLVRERIAQLPYFNGVLTEAGYRSFLQASGMTGTQLESATRQDIAIGLFRSAFQDLSSPTDQELRSAFKQENKKLAFHLVSFAPAEFAAKVNSTDDAKLREFFEEQKQKYEQPAKVQYRTAIFRAADFAAEVTVTDEDIAEGYERMREGFVEPARVSFRRILLKKKDDTASNPLDEMVSGEDAKQKEDAMSTVTENQRQKGRLEEALKRIQAGESFADVAKQISEDEATKDKGGDIGWTEYSVLTEPTRSKLFSLEVGQVSDVVEATDGFYLLLVDGKQEKREKPLEEVREQVKRRVQAEFAPEYARVASEQFLSALQADGNKKERFAALTSEKKLPMAETAQPVQAGQASGTIPVRVTDVALGLSASDSELVEVGEDSYVVLVDLTVPPTIPNFEELKPRVIEDFVQKESRALAQQAADAFLASLKEKNTPENNLQAMLPEMAKAASAKFETTELAAASAPTHALLRTPGVSQVAFQLNAQRPVLDRVESTGSEFHIVVYASEQLPPDSDFAQQQPQLLEQQKNAAGERIFTALQKILRSEAEVWVEPKLLTTTEGA